MPHLDQLAYSLEKGSLLAPLPLAFPQRTTWFWLPPVHWNSCLKGCQWPANWHINLNFSPTILWSWQYPTVPSTHFLHNCFSPGFYTSVYSWFSFYLTIAFFSFIHSSFSLPLSSLGHTALLKNMAFLKILTSASFSLRIHSHSLWLTPLAYVFPNHSLTLSRSLQSHGHNDLLDPSHLLAPVHVCHLPGMSLLPSLLKSLKY